MLQTSRRFSGYRGSGQVDFDDNLGGNGILYKRFLLPRLLF